MVEKFLKGAFWGAGFATALVVILLLAENFLINKNIYNSNDIISLSNEWNTFTKDQQISKASVIAIVRYSKGANGSMDAKISHIYKESKDIIIDFKIGDKYPSLDYYQRNDSRPRSGVVVFFTGSPAKERSTLYLYEDRILAYGDMPLDILITQFENKTK